MAVRRTALRLAPLTTVFALGALGLAAPALAGTTPAPVATSITEVDGVLTVPAPAVGVNNKVSAKLTGPAGVVVGRKLTFTTASTGGTPARLLCTATTDSKGVGACNAFVGVDPAAITTKGLSQIAAKGAFTVAFAADSEYLASNGAGAATFYGTPHLPGSSARR